MKGSQRNVLKEIWMHFFLALLNQEVIRDGSKSRRWKEVIVSTAQVEGKLKWWSGDKRPEKFTLDD